MLRNVIYITGSIIIFFIGIIIYGIILNIREVSLDEALIRKNLTKIDNPLIEIERNNYTLVLYSDSILVKTYSVVFGRNSGKIKLSKDDLITPDGEYYICSIDTNDIYYKKLYINFPNLADASEALREGVINRDEFIAIKNSLDKKTCSFKYTKLGADIGIHGIGEYNLIFKNLPFVFNWTNGSVALSNEDIDELLSVVKIGTKVIIKN